MARLSEEQIEAWVAASCERQGLAVKVNDALVVARVAALLTDGSARPVAERGRAGPLSQSPDGLDPVGVER